MENLTPAMRQYVDIKKKYKDTILFFRMGDFYETFFDDAKICSEILDIVLTSKNRDSENPIPMAGIPYHSSEKYISKLINAGYKVAIAEQMSDPQPGKIVEREVVAVITPGTYFSETEKNYNFIASINFFSTKESKNFHIAFGDFSVGEYRTKSFSDIEDLKKFILQIKPKEIIIPYEFDYKQQIYKLKNFFDTVISIFSSTNNFDSFLKSLLNIQTLESYGEALKSGRGKAFALLMEYLSEINKQAIKNIFKITYWGDEEKVLIDDITYRNLEIFESFYDKSTKFSLLGVIDNTVTGGGNRKLKHFLLNPSQNIEILKRRFSKIQYYFDNIDLSREIQSTLKKIPDIHRLSTKIFYKKLSPAFFLRLKEALKYFFSYSGVNLLNQLKNLEISENVTKDVELFFKLLQKYLKEEIENEEYNYIQDGLDQEIDELRKILFNSDELLLEYQKFLREITGVNTLKLKYVKNQGYFLEISQKESKIFEQKLEEFKKELDEQSKKKLEIYKRNTLKQSQRYSSTYLENLQQKLFSAKDELIKKEYEKLEFLKSQLEIIKESIFEFYDKISLLDLFCGYGILSKRKNYTKPNFNTKGIIEIKGGRHPVIEEFLPIDEKFVENDLKISSLENKEEDGFIHIITGPNMGGKSTFLRQNAIICLLAHCGFFVPCNTANISILDGIYARVGSGDVIAKNQSTFMTEMIEVSNILSNASKNSFIIFDELGRGTSTYDGLSLSKAILLRIYKKLGAKTLIATHYHELIELEKQFPGIKNFSVSVYETDSQVVFLKKVVKGGASKSYGIEVAKLAGINKEILQMAENFLQEYEKKVEKNTNTQTNNCYNTGFFSPNEIKLEDPKVKKFKEILESIDLNNITPLQAFQILIKLKELLK